MGRERGVVLSGPEVRALLDAGEVELRRLCQRAVHTIGGESEIAVAVHPDGSGRGWIAWFGRGPVSAAETRRRYPGNEGWPCPLGAPGDRLWVRETFGYLTGNGRRVVYRADGDKPKRADNSEIEGMKWTPSVRMPRWASRLDASPVEVRVERDSAGGWEWVVKTRRLNKEAA